MPKIKQVNMFLCEIIKWDNGPVAHVTMISSKNPSKLCSKIKKAKLKGICSGVGQRFIIRVLKRGEWMKVKIEPYRINVTARELRKALEESKAICGYEDSQDDSV